MIKWLLQGKWLGHPLHSILVHLPIGLYVISLILDIASHLVADGNPLVRSAFYCMVLGTITALLAVFPGLADWLDIRADHPAKQLGIYHMVLNLVMIALYGVNISTRIHWLYDDATRPLGLGLSLLGIALLGASGYIGGVMVYDDGIGVGRHRRRGKTPDDTIVIDAPHGENAMTPLVTIAQLDDRQTLRVQVNGVIMAVAKVNGNVYAFQEFCTHRFGPLSEGCFTNGQVMCPWHRSCFDLSSGQVTSGPAKEPIRTFRTEIRDGQVFVEVPPPPQRDARKHQSIDR